MAGLARLATSDTAVALENMPILVELGDIGKNHLTSKFSQSFIHDIVFRAPRLRRHPVC